MEVTGSSPVGSTNNEKINKMNKELLISMKEKLQDLNTCLQNNSGLMSSDAFSELDSIMNSILDQINTNLN
jgi:hypothetical protein